MLQGYQAHVEEIERLVGSLESELVPLLERLTALTSVKEEHIAAEIRDAKQALTKNRRVRLAVMGQVKSGKSTLLNALLFEGRPYLPTAATPKTARLTVISASKDGEPPGAVIHFYTREDWEDICEQAAKERRQRVESVYADVEAEAERKLGSQIPSLLGTTRRVSFVELEDYVAENGQFTPLVKFTELYYPDMPFDDLEVVDTPGLNDPVRSRERQTVEYLRQADAVIFLSSPQRFLDREDMTLVLRDMIHAGIQEVVVVVPQMDALEPNQKEDFLRKCLDRMSERAARYAEESGFGPMARDFARNVFVPRNTVMVSALADILAKRLERGEELTEDESWCLNNLLRKNGWPVEDPDQLQAASNMRDLAVKIENRIIARKGEILLRGPINRLSASVNELAAQNERRLDEIREDLHKVGKDLEQRKREREAELEDFKRYKDEVEKRLERFKRGFLVSVDRRPSFRLAVPQVTVTPWWGSGKKEEARALAEEIVLEAEEILREKSQEIFREYQRSLEKLEESVQDLLPTLSGQVSLTREVNAMLSSLVKRIEAALDNTHIRVNVSFSYSLLDKLFGGARAIAQKDVARACMKARQQIKEALEEIQDECNAHVEEGIERLRGQLQSLLAEKQRRIEELGRVIVEGEAARARLEKQYRDQESLYQDLKKVIEKVGPWFDEVKRKMSGGVGC